MSGRYSFSPGESRYPTRERSPPGRYSEKRRPSSPRRDGPDSGVGDPDSRPAEESSSRNSHANSGRDFSLREAPKAPKAWADYHPRGRGSAHNPFIPSGPRGRGFFGRGEPRGRGCRFRRGSRDRPYFRGDRDRNRSRREAEFDDDDRRQSPSPRERRDTRDYDYPKELDVDRARRTSKDGPLSAASSSSDPSLRSGVDRTRDQGDWTAQGSARRSFHDERDRFHHGFNAREGVWEKARDDPDRDRDFEKRILRREESKRIEREEREREAEKYKKDRAAGHLEQWTTSGASANVPTSHVVSTSAHESGGNRRSSGDSHTEFSFNGRASGGVTASYNPETRRDKEEADRHGSRIEPSVSRHGLRVPSPPRAPPVPAFGSQSHRSSLGGTSSLVWKAPTSSQGLAQSSNTSNDYAASKPLSTEPNKLSGSQPALEPRADGDPEHAGTADDQNIDLAKKNPLQENDNLFTLQSNSSPGPSRHASAPSSDPRLQHTNASPERNVSTPFKPSHRSVSVSAQGYGYGARDHLNQGTESTDSAGKSFSPPGAPFHVPRGPRAGRIGRVRNNQWIRVGMIYPTSRNSYSGPVSVKRDNTGRERGRYYSVGRGMGRHSVLEVDAAITQDFNQMNIDEQTRKSTEASTDIKNEDHQVTEDVELLNVSAKEDNDQHAVGSSKSHDGNQVDEDEPDFLEEVDMEDIWAKREDEIQIATVKAQEEKDKISGDMRLMLQVLQDVYLIALRKMAEAPEAVTHQKESPIETKATEVNSMPTFTDVSMESVQDIGRQPSVPDVPSARPKSAKPEAHWAFVPQPYKPYVRPKTPPVDSLPFLIRGPQKPFRELEVMHENEKIFTEHRTSIMELLEARVKEEADRDERLRREWTENYRQWRNYVEQLDDLLGMKYEDEQDQKASSPENTSPAVQMTPIERRRGGKYASEHDIQEVLKKSAEEEKERAKQLAGVKSVDEKEANIPDMLNERQRYIFRDRNRVVSPENALEVFQFQPAEDDFTEEEQRIFVERFQAWPKNFGKIAEALPGRNFQQCMEHYYRTKGEARYKQLLSKRKKRGRRAGPGTQSKPRSTALIRSAFAAQPDVVDGDDLDPPAVAVTDTGRPRRAAAPTFGENTGDNESNTPLQTPGRKTGGASRSDVVSDAPIEKGTRRTRGGATRERGQRRGRNQLIAAAPAPQQTPAQPLAPLGLEGSKETPPLMNRDQSDLRMKDLESAQLLAGFQAGNIAVGTPVVMAEENLAPLVPASTRAAISPKPSRSQTRSAAQTSSYWSVPETTIFPQLLDSFGTDWHAIAAYMTSKTHVMVKNFYKREVDNGRMELKQRAEAADAKKLRGEVMGPPPAPTQSRRRHESSQPSVPRQLAPNIETIEIEDDSPPKPQPAVLVQTSPPQFAQRQKAPVLAQTEPTQNQPEPLQRAVNLQPRAVLSTPQHVEQIRSSQATQDLVQFYEEHNKRYRTSEAQTTAQTESQQSFHGHPSLQPQQGHSNYRSPVSGSPVLSTYTTLPSSHQATSVLGQQLPVFDTSQSVVRARVLAAQQQQTISPQRSQQAPRQKNDPYKDVPAVSSPTPRYPVQQSIIAPRASRSDLRSIVSPMTESHVVPATTRQSEPAQRKTSNIMSLLNTTEPEEPRVPLHYDQTRAAPTPPPPAPQAAPQLSHTTANPQLYFVPRQNISPTRADQGSRREQAAAVDLQVSSGHPAYSRRPTYTNSNSSYTLPTQHHPISLSLQDQLSSSSTSSGPSTVRAKWSQPWTVPTTTAAGPTSQYPPRQTASTATTKSPTSADTGTGTILTPHHLQYAPPTASATRTNLQQQQVPVQYHHPQQQQPQQQANPLHDNPHRSPHQRTRSVSSSAAIPWPGAGSHGHGHGHGHGSHMY